VNILSTRLISTESIILYYCLFVGYGVTRQIIQLIVVKYHLKNIELKHIVKKLIQLSPIY